ncbi:MAG: NADP-dependent isocitrate dehydrogenase [Pseudomonadota bacterium]|nr:NADP-dependent isocitrate dehydrogenase [Pseudomonadota bacterium]
MTDSQSKIIYTQTDEAPALATYSFLPIIKKFASACGIKVELFDISLAGRIIANFPENIPEDQKQPDFLSKLGELVKRPEANIIKLPNISASIPQLKAAINELQSQGFKIPDYPEEPKNDSEKEIKNRYGKVLGSAVNPILREGNSDRRVADAVKQFAKDNPHSMSDWSKDSKSHVAHMDDGDFYSSEKSAVIKSAGNLRIEFVDSNGMKSVLKEKVPVTEKEIIDAAVMDCNKLRKFFLDVTEKAKEEELLLSLHLKATMMKVSDPIMFGHAVEIYYQDLFKKYDSIFNKIGIDSRNGLGDVESKIQKLPEKERKEIEADLKAIYKTRPALAMVDSDKGITNLHVPSDVIIDASMPASLRAGGRMWGPDGNLHDTKAVIPDRSYAGIYQQVFSFCQANGAFDVKTMGNVSNVGLMAQKAQEYGSHDKTFEIKTKGAVQVVNKNGETLLKHTVKKGDIWRMCQTKDLPIIDWVKLAVNRARSTGNPAIFWLDPNRAHDANLIKKVNQYLKKHETTDLDIQILPPVDAISITLERVKNGQDTISVTGNVLRDYLTDLFPILELGTSAKMLSIVPLLAGGGLYETGAGGSAPKHVQQFEQEGHLRWDSLGEFLALAVSIEELAEKTNNEKAKILGQALNKANSKFLIKNKSPSRKVRELDNRGSHFYLALYWAEALAEQKNNIDLKNQFTPLAKQLKENEKKIITEINDSQGSPIDLGGYYRPNEKITAKAMRPSKTLNQALNGLYVAAASPDEKN